MAVVVLVVVLAGERGTAAEQGAHMVPLFPSAAQDVRQGFVRVINHSAEGGEVSIKAFDDSDWDYAPIILTIDGIETVHFNSNDLENGNADKGLSEGVGPGDGDWWLELASELDIEVLAYIRTTDGFLTAMNSVAPRRNARYRVPTFNPGSNDEQESLLRLVNPGRAEAQVSITGIDGRGGSPAARVELTVPPGMSRTLDAHDLENGGTGLEGTLGDGYGKWQLHVASEQQLVVMSLMQTPAGHLTNLTSVSDRVRQDGPDLVVASAAVNDANPVAGESVKLTVAVRNQGNIASTETTLRFQRSPDAVISIYDREIAMATVDGLPPSGEAEGSAVVDGLHGLLFLGACVDAVTGEVQPDNNCSVGVRIEVRDDSGEGKAIATTLTTCRSVDGDDAKTVTVGGSIKARRTAYSITVVGYANTDLRIGEQDIGDLSAGESMDFEITGTVDAEEMVTGCTVDVSWTEEKRRSAVGTRAVDVGSRVK